MKKHWRNRKRNAALFQAGAWGAFLVFASFPALAAPASPEASKVHVRMAANRPSAPSARLQQAEKQLCAFNAFPSKEITERPVKKRPQKDNTNNLPPPTFRVRYRILSGLEKQESLLGYKQQHAQNLDRIIARWAAEYELPETLIRAVIRAESDFDPAAVSSAGAGGIMQLMPGTAADMGVRNRFDPEQNIAGGVRYLAAMLREFRGDLRLALAAYNAGPNAVKQYNGIPPYPETREYVQRVLRYKREYEKE